MADSGQMETFDPNTKLLRKSNTLLYVLVTVVVLVKHVEGQLMNRPPQFVPGQDMSKFSLPENTPVNTPIYQLRGKKN